MDIKEFSEHVRKYVKEALPDELAEADVCVTNLDTGESTARVILLVIRPWNDTATGFYLDQWYANYSAGDATAESAAAAIINDRRLYNTSVG